MMAAPYYFNLKKNQFMRFSLPLEILLFFKHNRL